MQQALPCGKEQNPGADFGCLSNCCNMSAFQLVTSRLLTHYAIH